MTKTSGLALSRAFYEQCCAPLLARETPDLVPWLAAGLVGEGSECFGFDDSLSRDHDWGPAVCLWLPQEVLQRHGARLEAAVAQLPPLFAGFETRMAPHKRLDRVGPLPLEGFYARFIRLPHAPAHWQEWRQIPEHFLAVCTNGEVFRDDAGQFSAVRQALLAFYPEDVRLKKMAARCMSMAQAGQYNLPRCLRRGDTVAAMLAAARFAEQALSMVFLCNRRYMPFYKWAQRAAASLPLLGTLACTQVEALAALDWRQGPALADKAAAVVEVLCSAVAETLRAQGLSDAAGDWLLEHGPEVQSRIATPELRQLPVMLE